MKNKKVRGLSCSLVSFVAFKTIRPVGLSAFYAQIIKLLLQNPGVERANTFLNPHLHLNAFKTRLAAFNP